MQITLTTDYAIRSLLYLALEGSLCSADEICSKMGIPKQYLFTMSKKFRKAGLLKSFGGNKGGYTLAVPPEKISLLDIISLTESTTKINRCLEQDCYCGILSSYLCPVREAYEKLQNMTDDYLKGITLEDLRLRMSEKKCEMGILEEEKG